MIIKSPIDLELTQSSGQTSQPPWKKINDSYREVVNVNDKLAIFDVKQSGDYLDFNFFGDISENEAVPRLRYIYDLDFDLDEFYKYLSNHSELAGMSDFCNGLRLFLAPDPFECVISSICSANNSIKRWTKSVSDIKQKWGDNYNGFYTFPEISTLQNVFLDDEEEFDLTNADDICKCKNNLKA